MNNADRFAWLVAGVSMTACVFAFGPLGGVEPPAGPVGDTSPSLAEIEAKIDSIEAFARQSAPNLVVSDLISVVPGTEQLMVDGDPGELVRLKSVIVTEGAVDVVGSGVDIAYRLYANTGSVGYSQYNFDIDVELPLEIRRLSSLEPVVTVLYQRLD